MSDTDTEVRNVVLVDAGPVRNAALILATTTTLAEHVSIDEWHEPTAIQMNGEIPFEMWGSGTQSLWRLLSAIAYTSEAVSLYEVASRLDARNSAAAANALAALFDGAR